MKHRTFVILTGALLGLNQWAAADALLMDVYATTGAGGNPASYTNWVNAGVAEDVSGAAGGSFHAENGSIYNISGGLSYTRSGYTGNYGATTFGDNMMLNDYLFVNQGTVSVSISGLENTLTTDAGFAEMGGNTFALQADTDYKLYFFGAGDSDGQDAAFTFDGVSQTTASAIVGTDEDADHYVVFEFTTPSDVTGYTLDFTYSNNSSDYAAWNGLALVEIPDTNSFVIEAEDYTSQSGTSVEDCEDEGGGSDLGSIKDGAWCMYEDITLGSNSKLNFRVARDDGKDDSSIEVWLDAASTNGGTQIAEVDVPETGGWQVWETVSTTVGEVEGAHDVYLVFSDSTTNNGYLCNINWWSREDGPPRVEAEDYTDGEGYEDDFETAYDFGGGENLGWIEAGEWMEYTIDIESAGLYVIDFRVASGSGGGGIDVISGGSTIGAVSIGDTGGWQEWETVSTYVYFSETGEQTLRLEFTSEGLNLNWFEYYAAGSPEETLLVGDTRNQMMRYGLDYERLTYWNSTATANAETIAEWSVNDCNVDYLRTAMNCEYELTETNFYLKAYTKRIIPMMTAMQEANPNIKWFATPRPLNESEDDEKWQPYPLWVTGADSGDDNFDFNAANCADYLIRYLLLMKSYGFKITYMDWTNEWQSNYESGGRVSPDDCVTMKAAFDAYLENPWPHPALDQDLLLEAEDFPLMVGASSWNYDQGGTWISKFTTEERRNAIDIASSHNTDRTGTPAEFAAEARDTLGADTEVWNSELHGWKDAWGENNVTSFYYVLSLIRGGFNGIDMWMALGTGEGHSVLLNDDLDGDGEDEITREQKYFMYQKLLNTSNYGYALDIDLLDGEDDSTAALIRENLLTVWVVNTSTDTKLTEIDFGNYEWDGSDIQSTRWCVGLDDEGISNVVGMVSNSTFTAVIEAESTYCFEIPLVDNEDNFPFVQAENYTDASGVSVESCSDTDGGEMVSFAGAGDEISFDLDITKTYTHDVAFRVASESADIAFDIYSGTNLVGSVDRIATGGDQTWTTVYASLPLDGGPMELRVVASSGGWNLNWIEFDMEYYSTTGLELEVENLATGKTYSASNVYGDSSSYAAAMAFDGDRTDTRWATDEAPAWLQVDFGTPTSINAVSFYEYGDRTEAYEIQYSNDGATWYTAYEGGNPTDGEVYIFPTVTAEMFRYQSISTPDGSPTIYELEFYCADIDPNVDSMEIGDNSLTLSWSGVEGLTYSLQRSTNLVEGFETIETGIPVQDATNICTVAAPDEAAFYRILFEE